MSRCNSGFSFKSSAELASREKFLINSNSITTRVCVCVFFPFILEFKFVGRISRVTQEEGHTEFFIHLLSAVRVLIFLARRIQPFLSLVDREDEFCILTVKSFSTRWAFLVLFLVF